MTRTAEAGVSHKDQGSSVKYKKEKGLTKAKIKMTLKVQREIARKMVRI